MICKRAKDVVFEEFAGDNTDIIQTITFCAKTCESINKEIRYIPIMIHTRRL